MLFCGRVDVDRVDGAHELIGVEVGVGGGCERAATGVGLERVGGGGEDRGAFALLGVLRADQRQTSEPCPDSTRRRPRASPTAVRPARPVRPVRDPLSVSLRARVAPDRIRARAVPGTGREPGPLRAAAVRRRATGPAPDAVTDDEQKILEFAAEHRAILPNHIQPLLSITAANADRLLAELARRGLTRHHRTHHQQPGHHQITSRGLAAINSPLPEPRYGAGSPPRSRRQTARGSRSSRVSPAPLVGPQVKDVMKVDVGKQRRN